MDKDYDKLIKYLDKKFQKTTSKEAITDLTNRVISIEEKVETLSTKKDLNNLRNSIDAYAKKADTYFQEMVMLAHKVDRLERWINQIAKKVGVRLKA